MIFQAARNNHLIAPSIRNRIRHGICRACAFPRKEKDKEMRGLNSLQLLFIYGFLRFSKLSFNPSQTLLLGGVSSAFSFSNKIHLLFALSTISYFISTLLLFFCFIRLSIYCIALITSTRFIVF